MGGQHRGEVPEDVALRRAWLGGMVLGLLIALAIWGIVRLIMWWPTW